MYDTSVTLRPFLGLTDCVLEVGGKRLLDIPDLELASQGITAVMGPNGAGKSLMLRVLHGLATPTSGSVTADGEPQSRLARRKQSLVLQAPVLLRRSAEANIRFVLRARK